MMNNPEQEIIEKINRLKYLEQLANQKKPRKSPSVRHKFLTIGKFLLVVVAAGVFVFLIIQMINLDRQYKTIKRDISVLEEEHQALAQAVRENNTNVALSSTTGE